MNTIHKLGRTLAMIISIASAASLANAQGTGSANEVTDGTNAPVTNNASSADNSRATAPADPRWGSPPVDRTARPDDPIPKATTLQQREKRFADEEREWQRLSTP
ncbi:MAG TPA: hypothetical protein VEO36_00070 [Casimicrobiaceae bacterium]|nr:hypothetical protein [Casimicrobiaceae bacterium]